MRIKRISLKNSILLELIQVKLKQHNIWLSKTCFFNGILVLALILIITYTLNQYSQQTHRKSLLTFINPNPDPPSSEQMLKWLTMGIARQLNVRVLPQVHPLLNVR